MGEFLLVEIYLGICAFFDVRSGKIPCRILLAAAVVGAVVCAGAVGVGERDAGSAVVAVLPGLLLMGYQLPGKVGCLKKESGSGGETEEKNGVDSGKIGSADGIMVLTAGLFKGGIFSWWLTAAACLFLLGFAVTGMALCRISWNSRIPYAPFLAAAGAVLWITGFF